MGKKKGKKEECNYTKNALKKATVNDPFLKYMLAEAKRSKDEHDRRMIERSNQYVNHLKQDQPNNDLAAEYSKEPADCNQTTEERYLELCAKYKWPKLNDSVTVSRENLLSYITRNLLSHITESVTIEEMKRFDCDHGDRTYIRFTFINPTDAKDKDVSHEVVAFIGDYMYELLLVYKKYRMPVEFYMFKIDLGNFIEMNPSSYYISSDGNNTRYILTNISTSDDISCFSQTTTGRLMNMSTNCCSTQHLSFDESDDNMFKNCSNQCLNGLERPKFDV